jgi:hypothetical protein
MTMDPSPRERAERSQQRRLIVACPSVWEVGSDVFRNVPNYYSDTLSVRKKEVG